MKSPRVRRQRGNPGGRLGSWTGFEHFEHHRREDNSLQFSDSLKPQLYILYSCSKATNLACISAHLIDIFTQLIWLRIWPCHGDSKSWKHRKHLILYLCDLCSSRRGQGFQFLCHLGNKKPQQSGSGGSSKVEVGTVGTWVSSSSCWWHSSICFLSAWDFWDQHDQRFHQKNWNPWTHGRKKLRRTAHPLIDHCLQFLQGQINLHRGLFQSEKSRKIHASYQECHSNVIQISFKFWMADAVWKCF